MSRRARFGPVGCVTALALAASACSEPDAPAPSEADATEPALADSVSEVQAELLESLGYVSSEPAHAEAGVLFHDPARAYPGLNLYVSQHGQEAILLDMDGDRVHAWRGTPDETETAVLGLKYWWRTVHPLSDGGLLAQTDFGSLTRLDRDSNIIWSFEGPTHHDFDVRDDGHILVLTASPARTPVLAGEIFEDFLVELDPQGQLVRRVSILQALIDGEQSELLAALRQVQASKGAINSMDPMHTNTVEILDGTLAAAHPAFRRGNVLLSLPLIDRLAILDFEAGRIVWTLGGAFRHQHDPTLLPGGTLLLFDNKGLGERSRILEIDPLTGDESYSYAGNDGDPFYSECCGRVYRLPNSNTLVVDSKNAQAFEIDPAGDKVWEFRSPHSTMGTVAVLNDLLRIPRPDWIDTEPGAEGS